MQDGFVQAASVGDIGENESRAFQIADKNILVCNTRDGIFAVENKCTHQLQELEGGKIRGCFIFCPLHGQRFNLKDGAPIGQLTDKPLPTFKVAIEDDLIYVHPGLSAGEQD